MQNKLIIGGLLLCLIGSCNRPKLDDYFNFPVQVVSLPGPEEVLHPEIVSFELSKFYEFWIDSCYFWARLAGPSEDILLAADITTGQEIGHFGKKGRGPQEFLNPMGFDLVNGHLNIFDVMNTMVYDLNLRESLENKTESFSSITPLDRGTNDYLPLLSIHRMGDSLIVLDTGAIPTSQDLYNIPDYAMYDLRTGKRIKDFNVFRSVPLSNSKKESKHVNVKSRLLLADCTLPDEKGICFVMKYFPQINFFSIKDRTIKGVRITELSDKALVNGFLHYNSVTAYEDKIYAVYVGGDAGSANEAKITTELHVFDQNGVFIHRMPLDGTYIDVRASDTGLYLSKLDTDGKTTILCRLDWNTLKRIR